jgi:histidyl-tRNA synthetase
MNTALRAVRGMNDRLPDEALLWQAFEAKAHDWLALYGYRPIAMPIVEHTALFSRAIGEVTDIVEKEMYAFEDALNGEHLTLRPEGTASCVRALIQHRLIEKEGPQRLYYQGPMFRHERPQKGRYRQFHQLGVEAIGFADPQIEAEHLLMCARLWKSLGLSDFLWLEINSLGTLEERLAHRADLVAYLEARFADLDEEGQRRLKTNPLRILDTKNPDLHALVEHAPKLPDYLGSTSLAHLQSILDVLTRAQVPFRLNPRLVRGLDYYNGTVFEWVTDALGSQGTVCAGGRYDGLIAQLGGNPQPACGFAIGLERLMLLWQEKAAQTLPPALVPQAYLVSVGQAARDFAFEVAEYLRSSGVAVLQDAQGGRFKAQLKKADASGAPIVLILGDDEAANRQVSFKPLRAIGEQTRVAFDDLFSALSPWLKRTSEEANDGRV